LEAQLEHLCNGYWGMQHTKILIIMVILKSLFSVL
jgi:hypothetical protein